MKNQIEEIYSIVIQSKGVSIDSRTLKPGQVFFALTGDNFDGSKFTEQALLNGALKAVVSDINLKARENIIYVENVLATLQEIARIHRLGLNIPVIALTGTNGKTTTKELINHLLSSEFNTLCTLGNLNNHNRCTAYTAKY
jgi:UDP-N-acetylmuramoyl-tripeptide--D-alanyl-D-alanine ligase